MNISRDEFVKTLIEKTEQIENIDVADFFVRLNGEKEQIFGNIYDITFSKKLCEVHEKTLNGLLIAFVGSEREEPENRRLLNEIDSIIPETKQLFNNINHLLKQPTVESPKLEFEENYTETQLMRDIKNSQISLFDLFMTKKGQTELIKGHIISVLKNKLPNETFISLHNILKKINILSYDMKGNKIIIDTTNKMEMFYLQTIREQILPLKMVNIPNENISNEIDTLDKFIEENIGLKENQLETIDINHDTKQIVVKRNCEMTDIQKEHIYRQIESKNSLIVLNGFRIVELKPDFLGFVNKHFDGFLLKSNLNALRLYCRFNDISFKTRRINIRLSEPNKNLWEKIDEQFCLNKDKFKTFFPEFGLEYSVMKPSDEKSNKTQKPEEEAKKKIMKTNSPVSMSTDETLTLDNFHALEKRKVQGIIDLIKEGKSIAINGTTGSGKTHLAHALKNTLKTEFNTVYTTGEKFCSVFRGLAKNYKGDKNKANNLRNTFLDSFEGIDVLIIDGIEYLGGDKGPTQNILKQILSKNPDMRLVITSKMEIKDIPWKKKHKSVDGAVGFESSNLFQEIKNLNLVMLQSPAKENSEKIIQDQRKRFLNKKNDLFLPMELPVGVVNFLSKKVNPSLYEQIFESIKLNSSSNFSCEELFKIIQSLVSEKIRPDPEEIIEIIIDSFAKNGLEISKHIALGTDITLWDKKEIEGRFYSELKDDHLKKTMVSFCIFFIQNTYPKKTFTEIGSYFGNRKNCSKLYNDALSILTSRRDLLNLFENNIKKFLQKMYGVDGQQISVF